MIGPGGSSGLPRIEQGDPVARLALVPVSANRFFVTVPLREGGALSYGFVRNNGGDLSTPPSSVGTSFQPWRLASVGWLVDPAADPAAPSHLLSSDIGAQDYALQWSGNGLFGGSYHGGEEASANLVLRNGMPHDPAVAAIGTSFAIQHSSTITWSAGNTATIGDYSLTINPDGSLTEVLPVSSSLSFAEAFLGMLIAGGGSPNNWTEADLNPEGWTVPLKPGRAILLQNDDITIRDTASGRFMRCISNARAQAGFSRTQFVNTTTRSKLYYRFTGTLGARTAVRRISFGIGPAGTRFDKSNLVGNGDFTDGLTGWLLWGATSAAAVAGQLRLTRQASDNRVYRGFATQAGAVYLAVTDAVDAAAGGFMAVTSNANGSTSSPVPPILQVVVAGVNMQMFTATQDTHYLMLGQSSGSAGMPMRFGASAVYRLS